MSSYLAFLEITERKKKSNAPFSRTRRCQPVLKVLNYCLINYFLSALSKIRNRLWMSRVHIYSFLFHRSSIFYHSRLSAWPPLTCDLSSLCCIVLPRGSRRGPVSYVIFLRYIHGKGMCSFNYQQNVYSSTMIMYFTGRLLSILII